MRSGLFRRIMLSDRGLRTGWAIMVLILLIVAGEAVLVDPLGLFLERLGIGQLRGTTSHDWSTLFNESAKRFVRVGVVLGAAQLVLSWSMRRSLRSAGLRIQTGTMQDVSIGVGMGLLIQSIALIFMYGMGWFRIVGLAWQFQLVSSLVPSLLYASVIGVETAFIEEVLFRGFLITMCRDRYGLRNAVLISALLFGLVHFSGFSADFPWWASVVSATLAGLLLAQAFLLRGNLWLPIGMHFAWIVAARVLGTVGVDSGEAICLVTEVNGPELFVATRGGGAGGVELAGVALVSLLLWSMARTDGRLPSGYS